MTTLLANKAAQSTVALDCDGAAVSGSTIVITLSADPAATVKVRSFAGYDWGDALNRPGF